MSSTLYRDKSYFIKRLSGNENCQVKELPGALAAHA
jgi:hypothetical protein